MQDRYTSPYRYSKGLLRVSRLCVLLLLLVGCRPSAEQGQSSGKLQLATTIAPAAALLQELGDSLVQVTTLLPQGSSPEHYDPTTKDLSKLMSCRAYFYMGDLGFERSWVARIGKLAPELELIRLDSQFAAHQHEHLLHDPHYWTSEQGLRSLLAVMATNLSRLDTAHRTQYLTRQQALQQEVTELFGTARSTLSKASRKSFLIYHPSLTELAEELGLEQLVLEEDGKEPSPAHLAKIYQRAQEQRPAAIFIQREFDSKLIESLAQNLGIKPIVIDPLAADWRGQLRLIISALTADSHPQ